MLMFVIIFDFYKFYFVLISKFISFGNIYINLCYLVFYNIN